MKYNRDVLITVHACERFLERFSLVHKNGNREEGLKAAEIFLKEIWAGASYVSDDDEGIKFRNTQYDCDLIVQNQKIITVFHSNNKREHRRDRRKNERKRDPFNSNDAPDDIHIPPGLKARERRRS